jgi:hypothetical protein
MRCGSVRVLQNTLVMNGDYFFRFCFFFFSFFKKDAVPKP